MNKGASRWLAVCRTASQRLRLWPGSCIALPAKPTNAVGGETAVHAMTMGARTPSIRRTVWPNLTVYTEGLGQFWRRLISGGHSFDGDVDADIVTHVRRELAGVELGALDGGERIGTQGRLFHHGVGHGQKVGHLQGH